MGRKKKSASEAMANEDAVRSALSDALMIVATEVGKVLPKQTDFILMVYPFGISNAVNGIISTTNNSAHLIGALRAQTQQIQDLLLHTGDTVGHA